ncbi:hypothetical protein N7468_001670 [Penicillium chermesinum]|uniref:Ribosome biogenesis protein Alb1 n=1 Tax=Penicillium chermesinum TaxID=63820 RepID=A0A9W9PJZ7_9EURO|nr:uncharacterized protein N7468_001670 [Penicillium chermesinum]KAJ5246687.1 hypothetical protein N7468_001670 [Penicillium chermesinum]
MAKSKAESPTAQRPSVLANRASSGIQKKQKKQKLSRAQRLRQQKGMERAEAVLDQLEIKKAKSITRSKIVKARRGDWEELNKKSSAFAALQQDEEDEDEDDDAMTDTVTQSKENPITFSSTGLHPGGIPAVADPAPIDEDDQIT